MSNFQDDSRDIILRKT